MTYVIPIAAFWWWAERSGGYSMPSSICKVDIMHARTRVHTSTKKSLADHKLEIYRRVICELIACELDDKTIESGPTTASGNGDGRTAA